jgi:hypothetical protein
MEHREDFEHIPKSKNGSGEDIKSFQKGHPSMGC